LSLSKVRFQVGGRLEHTRYRPEELSPRSFTGASAAAGVNLPLWRGGVLATNYTHSFRAPALEELYNHGPHTGNLTFEVGNAALRPERADGLDLAVRHGSARVHGEANFFYYALSEFVYLAPTGRIEHGLTEAQYRQAPSRYLGAEAHVDLHLRPTLLLDLALDAVDAQLRDSRTPLPRIPPARGRISLDYTHRNLRLKPELVLTNAQSQLFPTETRTAGYAVLNLETSYQWASQHALHVVSVNLGNAANRLYRNHLSFIKDWAPEMGRSMRLTYTVRFF
jgi:iron complex outermembrane receptor protein